MAARFGDRELFDRYLAAIKTATVRRDRQRLFSALGFFPDPALVQRAAALYLSSEFDPRESAAAIYSASGEDPGRQVVWDFVKQNYDAVLARTPREVTGTIPELGAGFCDAAHRKDVEDFFRGRIEKLPGGPRVLSQTLETIDLCIASRQAQEGSVKEFLKNY